MRTPMPLEWHPAYREEQYVRLLFDWLNDAGPFARERTIRLPKFQRPQIATRADEAPPQLGSLDVMVLAKQRAAGPVPFVGDARTHRAFYVWNFATDDAGRAIAGESTLHIDWRSP